MSVAPILPTESHALTPAPPSAPPHSRAPKAPKSTRSAEIVRSRLGDPVYQRGLGCRSLRCESEESECGWGKRSSWLHAISVAHFAGRQSKSLNACSAPPRRTDLRQVRAHSVISGSGTSRSNCLTSRWPELVSKQCRLSVDAVPQEQRHSPR